jgi:hypothetical protein
VHPKRIKKWILAETVAYKDLFAPFTQWLAHMAHSKCPFTRSWFLLQKVAGTFRASFKNIAS